MNANGSWRPDLLRLGLLAGLCLLLGVYLIWGTVLITRDGVFYIDLAEKIVRHPAEVSQRYPPGYPFMIWLAHGVTAALVGTDSTMLWVYSGQGASLLCRVLALVPLYFLGRLLVGARDSFWALLILLVLPYPAQYGSDVLREWPHLLFLSLGFCLLYWALRRRRWWVFGLVGLAAGLGSLIRTEGVQLVVYALLGLALAGAGRVPAGDSGPGAGLPAAVSYVPRSARASRRFRWMQPALRLGAACLLAGGFILPVAPYVLARGTIVPHQLQPPPLNLPPVLSAIGSKAACDDPLEFELAPGELLELPIQAADPGGHGLTFSLESVPVGACPVYEFRSRSSEDCFWTVVEAEKRRLLEGGSHELWEYRGIACYAYAQPQARRGLQRVRWYSSATLQRHLFSISTPEIMAVVQASPRGTWKPRGVAFYVFNERSHPRDAVPVCRFRNQPGGTPPAPEQTQASTNGRPPETVCWYGHLGEKPPAGARIEEGVFRWRPGPDQGGDHQINIIASDGELQTCQLVKIRVTAPGGQEPGGEGRKTEDRRQRTEDGGRRTADGGQKAADGGLRTEEGGRLLNPRWEHAGLEKLPGALDEVFTAVAEDLMVVFFPPWLLGLCHRLRRPADRMEQALIGAVVIVNLALMLGRHIGVGPGSDRRYGLAMIALTIFYVPVGVDIMAQWLERVRPFGPQPTTGAGQRSGWFYVLVVTGVVVCMPKLMTAMRTDKIGYRTAAEWLRQNTQPQDVIAVPDTRISFYADRRGLPYERFPDWRNAQCIVTIAATATEASALDGWRREFSVRVHPRRDQMLAIYCRDRPGK